MQDSSNEVLMTVSIKTYASDSGLVIFEQSFAKEINVSTKPMCNGLTVFPAFSRTESKTDLSGFAYDGGLLLSTKFKFFIMWICSRCVSTNE